MLKPTEIDLRLVISSNYLMPRNMLESYVNYIEKAMPESTNGRPRADLKRILHAIYFVLRTGIQWDALPFVFGRPKTVYHWYSVFSKNKFFEVLWTCAVKKLLEFEILDLRHQSVDSSQRKAPAGGEATGPSPVDRAKSGSKISLHVEANGLPLGLIIAPANLSDQKLLQPTFMDAINRFGQQRNSLFVHLDRGFDSKTNVDFIKNLCLACVVPDRVYKKRKQLHIAKPPDKFRWVVERTISWLGRCRRVFVRHDRLAIHYLSWVQLAAQRLCFARL